MPNDISEVEEKILNESFTKKCERCDELGLVPNNHKVCIECLAEDLDDSEYICLSCGETKDKTDLRSSYICWKCITTYLEESTKKLSNSLSKDQKKLFEEYTLWNNRKVDAIILDNL